MLILAPNDSNGQRAIVEGAIFSLVVQLELKAQRGIPWNIGLVGTSKARIE